MTPDTRILKRKKAVVSESSSDDDRPLSLSPSKAKAKSVAVSMPGAVEATTAKPSAANGRRASRSTKPVVESDSDDDAPLAKPQRAVNGKAKATAAKPKPKGRPPKKKPKQEESEPDIESEDGTPPPPKKAPAKRKVKEESDADESFSEDDKPLKKKRAAPAKKAAAPKKAKAETPDNVKPKKRGAKKEESVEATPKKGKAKKEEDAEEIYKWWEEGADRDGSVKWETLEHNGVYFPPPYEPLPKHVKMKYNGAYASICRADSANTRHAGQTVDLPPESEEVAGFYGAMLETDHAKDATFNKNFFDDFLKTLKKYPPVCPYYRRHSTTLSWYDLSEK